MANFIKEIIHRIKTDWIEWRTFEGISRTERKILKRTLRAERRDKAMIENAIARARLKNASDKRTYYIMRDVEGTISPLTKTELDFAIKAGFFPKMNYLQRMEAAIDIVTTSKIDQENFKRAKKRTNKNGQKTIS